MLMRLFGVTLVVLVVTCVTVHSHEDEVVEKDGEKKEMTEQELEYQKGSLCGYCTYCKFCKLCDADCPCEKGPGKPNCHMCKYCRYCYLCKVCDSVCQPGGIIDSVTSKIYNALPTINKEEIDDDIKGVQRWIDKKNDEL